MPDSRETPAAAPHAGSRQMLDAFPHILPPRYFERLAQVHPNFTRSPNTRARPALFDLDARFRMMDRFPGYQQVLTLAAPPIEEFADAQTGRDLARWANDEMAELVQKYTDRFVGFATALSMLDPESAVAETRRGITELGALGAQVYTNVAGHPLDEEQYAAFFATLAELDGTLWIHPTRTADHPDYASETKSKYFLFMKLGWPYETAVCISRLIFSGIMDQYPNLRVLTHHAGGIIPHLAGRLVLNAETPEMRRAVGIPEEFTPERTLAAYKRFYGDTVFSGAHHPLECALGFYPLDHLLFGTDMPFGAEGGEMFIRETIAAVDELDVSEADRAALFVGNARALLRLASESGRHPFG